MAKPQRSTRRSATSAVYQWTLWDSLPQVSPVSFLQPIGNDGTMRWIVDVRDVNAGGNSVILSQEGQVIASIRPRIEGPAWLSEALSELAELTPDEGDLPLMPQVRDTAVRMLKLFGVSTPRPDLGVGRNGQVTLDWWAPGPRALSLEVKAGGRIVFTTAGDDDFALRGAVKISEETRVLPSALVLAIASLSDDTAKRV